MNVPPEPASEPAEPASEPASMPASMPALEPASGPRPDPSGAAAGATRARPPADCRRWRRFAILPAVSADASRDPGAVAGRRSAGNRRRRRCRRLLGGRGKAATWSAAPPVSMHEERGAVAQPGRAAARPGLWHRYGVAAARSCGRRSRPACSRSRCAADRRPRLREALRLPAGGGATRCRRRCSRPAPGRPGPVDGDPLLLDPFPTWPAPLLLDLRGATLVGPAERRTCPPCSRSTTTPWRTRPPPTTTSRGSWTSNTRSTTRRCRKATASSWPAPPTAPWPAFPPTDSTGPGRAGASPASIRSTWRRRGGAGGSA